MPRLGRDLERRLAPLGAGAFFVWGALLGLAPIVAGTVTWLHTHGVWTTAAAAAGAAVAVVVVFALTVGRTL